MVTSSTRDLRGRRFRKLYPPPPYRSAHMELPAGCDRMELLVGWSQGSTARSAGTPLWRWGCRQLGIAARTADFAGAHHFDVIDHNYYAFVSDPEIPSSFVASLESAQTSDAEEPVPAHSSPTSSAEDSPDIVDGQFQLYLAMYRPLSSSAALSSFSSLEPLHSPSGRLLTLHLEKDKSVIWPPLIVGPVPQELSPSASSPCYMTLILSLVLFAIELLDIRKDREEAFECFVRAWHQAHLPSTAIKSVTHYLPPHTSLSYVKEAEENTRRTLSYYVRCIGEGAASVMPSASYETLSSIHVPAQPQPENGAEAWQRDRDAASCYFDRARAMNSDLDIPVITDERSGQTRSVHELETTLLDISHHHSASASAYSDEGQERAKDELIFIDDVKGKDNMDNAWYLYVPSLVGAGTALLVIGVIGALTGGGIRGLDSLSHWDRRMLMAPNASLLGSFRLYREMVELMANVRQGGREIVTPPVRLQYPDDHFQSPMTTMQTSGRQKSAASYILAGVARENPSRRTPSLGPLPLLLDIVCIHSSQEGFEPDFGMIWQDM
ncbi:hypothetical protein EDC04DRAFT_3089952 [Pisolithus marmoratus]|nr:hypothetical protein EDC04DRAFT_3089952 [Pisolithus marmoratus]